MLQRKPAAARVYAWRMKAFVLGASVAAAILLGLADDASAGGRGGRGFSHSGHHFSHFHGGTRVFIGATFIGAPLVYPYYAYPYYAPAPVYYAPPPTYVEPAPAPQSYWYYCAPSRAYYPYVRDCPSGWQRVVPQNSPPPPAG
jgi:hypothetical protein